MNVLSVILNKAASDLKVKYHHRCSSSKLTHVCFADDLLIFIDGSLSLVQNVLQVLKEFELPSGLAVSVQKSSFFASGLTQQELDTIKASTGMHQGSLHVCYLGIPMCTKKLSLQNCEVLLEKDACGKRAYSRSGWTTGHLMDRWRTYYLVLLSLD